MLKASFWLGLLLGVAGVVAAAGYVPWVDHPRLPSKTTVIPNGGRAEQFVIRLPADRISVSANGNVGIRGTPHPQGIAPVAFGDAALLLEHFKLRDAEGQVIGIAARHWTQTEHGPATTWSLVIPGRGALLLASPGEPIGRLDEALRAAGYRPGDAWSGNVRLPMSPQGADGRVMAGSEEFARLTGAYSEAWVVTGVSEAGELRATIELATTTYRGS